MNLKSNDVQLCSTYVFILNLKKKTSTNSELTQAQNFLRIFVFYSILYNALQFVQIFFNSAYMHKKAVVIVCLILGAMGGFKKKSTFAIKVLKTI